VFHPELQEVEVGSQTNINVTLIADAIGLEEVVAIGYGTQKKETVTGSVSAVKGEQLAKSVVANAANSLAGQLPGLISQNIGQFSRVNGQVCPIMLPYATTCILGRTKILLRHLTNFIYTGKVELN